MNKLDPSQRLAVEVPLAIIALLIFNALPNHFFFCRASLLRLSNTDNRLTPGTVSSPACDCEDNATSGSGSLAALRQAQALCNSSNADNILRG